MCIRFTKTIHSRGYFSTKSEVSQLVCKMRNYESAIETLNSLQSNINYLRNAKIPQSLQQNTEKLLLMKKYLLRSGLEMEQLDKLPVIHVSGTKGKGTTCAYSESILRHHGFKTGFYSSPHLQEVRERIRVDGIPISKQLFAQHFWNIYDFLVTKKEHPDDMPQYFRFLTIMAFHIFLEQKVDVAIIEVGIGGEYDCTNILRKVAVAGITSLGFDHTALLGNTIQDIAWNKAGIMKEGSKVFTVPQQAAAMDVLKNRSIERKCSLEIVDENLHLPFIQKHPSTILTNINLAITLAQTWMLTHEDMCNNNLSVDAMKLAIQNCLWPGRYDVRQVKNVKFYIDGAHTMESIRICSKWFMDSIKSSNSKRALMFNITGDRSPEGFLRVLASCHFDLVIFVPNIGKIANEKEDNVNYKLPVGEQFDKCKKFGNIWLEINSEDSSIPAARVETFQCVEEALKLLNVQGEYNLLTTGSLHLVGAVLSLLDPDLNGSMMSKPNNI